jgi:hypothetical protein
MSSLYHHIASGCCCIILVFLLLCTIVHIFHWLAHRTDLFGRYYAMLFYAVARQFNVTYVLPQMKKPINKKRNVFSLIGRYDHFMYWMMRLDSSRINAYEEAVKQHAQRQRKAVWLDIGTGAHMPLTRLLVKYEVAEHIHAVEANREFYQFAKTFRENLPDAERRMISLHGCYSKNVDWYTQDPRPNAVIHEIVGCISSDEGCIKVMHDTMENLRGNISFCIPYRIGTLCVPVSRPKLSIFSSLCSLLLSSAMRTINTMGIQGMFNPPADVWLCEAPKLIEDFVVHDYARKPLEKRRIFTTKFLVEKSTAQWTGFYLAPHILTSMNNNNRAAEIDALRCMTNWPVRYVQMCDYENAIDVKQGDEVHLIFSSNLTDECPMYRLEAWVNKEYLLRSSFAWKGPAIC